MWGRRPTGNTIPNPTFRATLSSSNEVPPVTNAEAGSGGTMDITIVATSDSAGAIIAAGVNFSGTLSTFPDGTVITAAHIHTGATGRERRSSRQPWPDGGRNHAHHGQRRPSTRPTSRLTVDLANQIIANPGCVLLQRSHGGQSGWRGAWPAGPHQLAWIDGGEWRESTADAAGSHSTGRRLACCGVHHATSRQSERCVAAAGLESSRPFPDDVRATVRTSCYDCHSDETRWPWYATVFPASLLIERDVEQGRGQMNFSRWSNYNEFDRADTLDEVCELARDSSMPLRHYRWLHPDATLSAAQVDALCAWTTREADRLMGAAE